MRRRKWLWAGLIAVAIVGTGWSAWVLTGPRTYLPPGTERLTARRDVARYMLALSPDGRQAAYTTGDRQNPGSFVFRSLHLLTREELVLAPDIGLLSSPVWLTNTDFAYVSGGMGQETVVVTAGASGMTRHALPPIRNPDSALADPATRTLFVAAYDSRQPKGAEFVLWRVSLDSAECTRQQAIHPLHIWMTRSADGSRWFVRQVDEPNKGFVLLDGDFSFVKRFDNFQPRDATRRVADASLSPDGARVACIRWSDTPRSRWLARAEESDAGWRSAIPFADLVLSSQNARVSSIDIYDFSREQWISLAALAGLAGGIAWHPNGRDLIVNGMGHLWRIPLPKHLQSPPAPGYIEPQ